MSELSSLSDKQLLDRFRYITDHVVEMKKKLEPMFQEYEKLRTEYLQIDQEIATRNGLPTLDTEEDKQG